MNSKSSEREKLLSSEDNLVLIIPYNLKKKKIPYNLAFQGLTLFFVNFSFI